MPAYWYLIKHYINIYSGGDFMPFMPDIGETRQRVWGMGVPAGSMGRSPVEGMGDKVLQKLQVFCIFKA